MASDELLEALGGLRIQFWMCPVDEHAQRSGMTTVEWVDNVAHCTFRGCGRTSEDPSGCNCDGEDSDGRACTGQCCGVGMCSCSTPEEAPDAAAR